MTLPAADAWLICVMLVHMLLACYLSTVIHLNPPEAAFSLHNLVNTGQRLLGKVLYVNTYIYIYMCIYIYTHIYIYAYMCEYIHISLSIHIYIYMLI